MRSILLERSMEFFDILKYDRSDWPVFWRSYTNEFHTLFKAYTAYYQLEETDVHTILNGFSRPFLDRIYQKNETIRHWKSRAAKAINQIQGELKLPLEDFSILMLGALGIDDVAILPTNGSHTGIIDIVSIIGQERIELLPEIAVKLARSIRDKIDRKNAEPTLRRGEYDD